MGIRVVILIRLNRLDGSRFWLFMVARGRTTAGHGITLNIIVHIPTVKNSSRVSGVMVDCVYGNTISLSTCIKTCVYGAALVIGATFFSVLC